MSISLNERDLLNSAVTPETKCVFVGGELDGRVMTVAEVKASPHYTGLLTVDFSAARSYGLGCPARLFDNCPKVVGYVGPMYGGIECPLRYETPQAYNLLSM